MTRLLQMSVRSGSSSASGGRLGRVTYIGGLEAAAGVGAAASERGRVVSDIILPVAPTTLLGRLGKWVVCQPVDAEHHIRVSRP
jgi:hypothetical protein